MGETRISTDEGSWQRLVSLGYVTDPLPGPAPPSPMDLSRAVQLFQCDQRIPITAALDDDTRRRLHDAHVDRTPWSERPFMDDPVVTPSSPTPKSDVT